MRKVICVGFDTEKELASLEAGRILFEHFDHRLPYPGDRGTRFDVACGKDYLLESFEEVERILEQIGSR